jgi:hypothetical protein
VPETVVVTVIVVGLTAVDVDGTVDDAAGVDGTSDDAAGVVDVLDAEIVGEALGTADIKRPPIISPF